MIEQETKEKITIELIHCGCGGEPHLDFARSWDSEKEEWIPNSWHRVICRKCGTQTIAFYTEAEAITAWNRAMSHQVTITWDGRIPSREIAKVNIHLHPCGISGECLNCGGDVYNDDPYCSHCGARLDWNYE